MKYKRFVSQVSLAIAVSLFAGTTFADKSPGDTSNGATDFTFHPKGQWWHNVGYATELTAFGGPFINAGQHPGEIYMTFWKEPDVDAKDGLSPALNPKDFTILHSLGTTFYYPAKEPPPPDPASLGYSADDFANADKIQATFPKIDGVFPKGYTASGCQRDGVQYFLIQGKDSSGVFLVDWVSKDKVIDVAVVPASILKGSFESILDNVNYYASGGMYELMEFGGYYYYLSRLPQSSKFDPSVSGTATAVCPEFPKAGQKGIEYPKSWTDAVASLKQQ